MTKKISQMLLFVNCQQGLTFALTREESNVMSGVNNGGLRQVFEVLFGSLIGKTIFATDMISRAECIHKLQTCKNVVADKFGVRSMRLFGSVARNEQNESSDVRLFSPPDNILMPCSSIHPTMSVDCQYNTNSLVQ